MLSTHYLSLETSRAAHASAMRRWGFSFSKGKDCTPAGLSDRGKESGKGNLLLGPRTRAIVLLGTLSIIFKN
jgi:hypothetical protein